MTGCFPVNKDDLPSAAANFRMLERETRADASGFGRLQAGVLRS